MKQPQFFLSHILEAISEIENYTHEKNLPEFINNPMCYNATIRQIEIIGEAISKLESNFITQYPNIPWQAIKAMRNILIHEYWQTDLEEVSHTVNNDMPELKRLIVPLISPNQPPLTSKEIPPTQ